MCILGGGHSSHLPLPRQLSEGTYLNEPPLPHTQTRSYTITQPRLGTNLPIKSATHLPIAKNILKWLRFSHWQTPNTPSLPEWGVVKLSWAPSRSWWAQRTFTQNTPPEVHRQEILHTIWEGPRAVEPSCSSAPQRDRDLKRLSALEVVKVLWKQELLMA